MKILKPGKWTLFVECHTCDAELLLEASDIKLHVSTQNVDDKEYFYCVCACCDCNARIPLSDIPENVRKAAYDEAHKTSPRPTFDSTLVRTK